MKLMKAEVSWDHRVAGEGWRTPGEIGRNSGELMELRRLGELGESWRLTRLRKLEKAVATAVVD